MNWHPFTTIILPVLFNCIPHELNGPKFISEIPVPAGFHRTEEQAHSFAAWLRNIRLKNNNTVYLFDGRPKANQSAQYAVLDIPVGNKDLQQCADAVMRLRAMWLHAEGRDRDIDFEDNDGKAYRYASSKGSFDDYLQTVFGYCGTLSLEKQLKQRAMKDLEIGDVFIKGGSPGHAMIVVDKAIGAEGKVVYMLAQSYMPAQDIHIVKNPYSSDLSPWYLLEPGNLIQTPEWTFSSNQLKTW